MSCSSKHGNRVVIVQSGSSRASSARTSASGSTTSSASSTWSGSSEDSGYGSIDSRPYRNSSAQGYFANVREVKSRKGTGVVIISHRDSHGDRGASYRDERTSDYYRSPREVERSGSGSRSADRRSIRDNATSGDTKEKGHSAIATDHSAEIPEDKEDQSEIRGGAMLGEPPEVSGAEDHSDSSEGEEEDDDSDGSEDEMTPQAQRPEGQRTSSGSSSDASLVSPLLDIRRRHMVERLMAEFRDLLTQTLGARSRPSGQESRSGSSSAGQGSRQGSTHGPHGNHNRPLGPNRRSPSSNGGSGGDGNPGEGSVAAGPLNPPAGRKFACPYFKRDPRKHGKHRSCVGPGWSTVHRVKEHIYRQHQLPAFCTRCGTTFAQGTDLVAHSRLALACDVRVFDPPDGFTKEQERALRRKKKLAGSEDTKWRAMYKVLFPDDDEADMPSPYHENGTDITWESRRSQEFDNYERYLRRELPRLVRQQLEIAASEASGPLENHLRGQLIEIVRDAQSQLFQRYRGEDLHSADAATGSSQGVLPESTMTGLELQHPDNGDQALVNFDFSAFYPQPLVDGNHVNPIDVFATPYPSAFGGEHHSRSDSGYDSMGLPAEFNCVGSSSNVNLGSGASSSAERQDASEHWMGE